MRPNSSKLKAVKIGKSSATKSVKRGQTTKIRRIDPYGNDWNKISEAIKRRDGYACKKCGDTKSRLNVHHIINVAQGGRNNPSNLVTLCFNCHSKQPRHKGLIRR